MENNVKEAQKNNCFSSLRELNRRRKDGTFKEIIDDWKWIFSYSGRYKPAIVFYVLLGVFGTTFGLAASIRRLRTPLVSMSTKCVGQVF